MVLSSAAKECCSKKRNESWCNPQWLLFPWIARCVKWFGKQVWAPERGFCRDMLLTITSPACGIGCNVGQWMFSFYLSSRKYLPSFGNQSCFLRPFLSAYHFSQSRTFFYRLSSTSWKWTFFSPGNCPSQKESVKDLIWVGMAEGWLNRYYPGVPAWVFVFASGRFTQLSSCGFLFRYSKFSFCAIYLNIKSH